jgi:hypothetical protein
MKRLLLLLFTIGLTLNISAAEPGTLTSPAAGTFQIRNKKHGELLRVEDAKRADGTPIVLYAAQRWKCMGWQLSPAGTDRYTLQNVFTGKTFAAKPGSADGLTTAVVQVPMSGAKPPFAWQFTRLSNGNYRISDPESGASLTATATTGDAHVGLAPWKQLPEQEWEILVAPEHFDM